MLREFRARLSYANVIATMALFLALGGSSYAALKLPKNSVGGRQLKKNSVTSPKVKPGSLFASDFKASQRSRLRGPAGPQGPQGSQGPPGPVTGNLPSGATLRGVYNLDFVAATAGNLGGGSISFAMRLPAKPSVNVLAIGAPPTANCPGSLTNPEAAPGVLCVYKSSEENTPGVVVCDQDCDQGVAERYGAELFLTATAAARAFSDGSWAVTAP